MAISENISSLPTPPSRSDSPSDFSNKADSFLAALPTLQTELNNYSDQANTTESAINTSESNAATSEQNSATSASDAASSADAAASAVNAVAWDSGTAYAKNDAVIGSNGYTYRSAVNSNTNNDPVNDGGTNWVNLNAPAPVSSVFGRTGDVTASASDISGLGTQATKDQHISTASQNTNNGDVTYVV